MTLSPLKVEAESESTQILASTYIFQTNGGVC